MAQPLPNYIPPNNWTTYIKNAIGTAVIGVLNFTIGSDGGGTTDPAPNCIMPKLFTSTYSCGNDPSSRTINLTNAWGKTAKYDCSETFNKCSNLRLSLDDNGVLSITDDKQIVKWSSSAPGINPDNPPLALEAYKAEGPVSDTGRAYSRNYLNSGEFLEVGQWIGSPSGKFRLEMVELPTVDIPESTVAAETIKTLRVVYNVLGCSNEEPINNKSSKLYSIPSINNNFLGKVGYIDVSGQLHAYAYDSPMVYYGANYESIGNYGIMGGNLGTSVEVANMEECKEQCSNYGATGTADLGQQCVGFEYEKDGRTCKLKSKSVFKNGKRFINDNYEYYARTKEVSPDSSCSNVVKTGNTAKWNELSANQGRNMRLETTCGLKKFTEVETNKRNAREITLNKKSGAITDKVEALYETYNKLKEKIFQNKTALSNSFNELQTSRQDLADWSGEQLNQLEAMNEDRDLNMMSQNYKHIMWSILAILIILGIIKLIKSISSPGSVDSPTLPNIVAPVAPAIAK